MGACSSARNHCLSKSWPLDTYLNKLKEILNGLPVTSKQLQGSEGFNVSPAALGSAALFQRHFPQTLEDCFTTIHQSLETILGVWAKDLIDVIAWPPLAARIHKLLKDLKNPEFDTHVQVTGITITSDEVTIFYNFPLQNHSAAFQLTWFKEKPART